MSRRIILSAALLAAALGCHTPAVQPKTPPDPLLITKKPIEGRPTSAGAGLSARLEPPPPPTTGDFVAPPIRSDALADGKKAP
jgi:hypothetical protein